MFVSEILECNKQLKTVFRFIIIQLVDNFLVINDLHITILMSYGCLNMPCWSY